MRLLGIESSCDETAASVVEDGKILLSSVVASSIDQHIPYGGIVPEIAARSHIESIIPVINQAIVEAKTTWSDIDGIAVTKGPGLGGSLLIGVLTARTLALRYNKPLYAVNHVEAHLYASYLTDTKLENYKLSKDQPKFPLLALIVSGGHCQFVFYQDHFSYILLGQTQDDAIGEAFDKVAKMLGLPYPGGPSISKAAQNGNHLAYKLPKAKMPGYDFSYSGLKTAVLRLSQGIIGKDFNFPSIELASHLTDKQVSDIAASFEYTAVTMVTDKLKLAINQYSPKSIIIAGGVAANSLLRQKTRDIFPDNLYIPDIKLCTDNAAMVATLGYFYNLYKEPSSNPMDLEIDSGLSM